MFKLDEKLYHDQKTKIILERYNQDREENYKRYEGEYIKQLFPSMKRVQV